MTDTTDHSPTGQPTETPTRSCSLCGDALVDGHYPRHQLTLADEADSVENRRVNRRLCQPCWQTLYTALTDETTIDSASVPRSDGTN